MTDKQSLVNAYLRTQLKTSYIEYIGDFPDDIDKANTMSSCVLIEQQEEQGEDFANKGLNILYDLKLHLYNRKIKLSKTDTRTKQLNEIKTNIINKMLEDKTQDGNADMTIYVGCDYGTAQKDADYYNACRTGAFNHIILTFQVQVSGVA